MRKDSDQLYVLFMLKWLSELLNQESLSEVVSPYKEVSSIVYPSI